MSTRACNYNDNAMIMSPWLRGRPCRPLVPLSAHRQPAPLVAAHALLRRVGAARLGVEFKVINMYIETRFIATLILLPLTLLNIIIYEQFCLKKTTDSLNVRMFLKLGSLATFL